MPDKEERSVTTIRQFVSVHNLFLVKSKALFLNYIKFIPMTNVSQIRIIILFSTFFICVASFSQSGGAKKLTLDSLLSHKWAVTVSSKEEMENSDKKILPFDASPPELPNTIEFYNNGTLSLNLKKGTWKTTPGKEIVSIVLDGKSTSYRVNNLENKKVKLHELSGQKKILLLTRLD